MNKPVKVLQMIAALNYGGSQAMIVNLCKAMDRKKVQCDFIVDHPEYMGMASIVESLGSKIYVVPTFKGSNILEVTKAWNELFEKHQEYSVLHSHSRSYASIYFPIAKKYGLKTIIHSHNTSNGEGLSAMAKNILQYPLRYQSDYYFGCSRQAGEWLFGKNVVNGDRFYILNNAIDTDSFIYNSETRKQYREQFGIGDEKVFIQVGRLSTQKNHMFTLGVFARYTKQYPQSKLFIVGNGELKNEIEERITELGIGDNVVILEYRNDVNNLLQMADYFLMPSLFEGLSVAAIEAQASGIRCLCSDNCDRNVDITGLCEFLPLETSKWINKMSELYVRRNKKQDIIESGFDVNTTARWLEDFYQNIVG